MVRHLERKTAFAWESHWLWGRDLVEADGEHEGVGLGGQPLEVDQGQVRDPTAEKPCAKHGRACSQIRPCMRSC